MNEQLMNLLPSIEKINAYTAKSSKLDRTGNFYHVTQQCYNRNSYYSLQAAKYRDHMFKMQCERMSILPICNVVMPNHTHDVVFVRSFESLETALRITNLNTSKFIRDEKSENGKVFKGKVFDYLPTYTRIDSVDYLFFLFKYLFDNADGLKSNGKLVPYSCFDLWKINIIKPYQPKFYEMMFNKNLSDISHLCESLSKEEFFEESKRLFGNMEKI